MKKIIILLIFFFNFSNLFAYEVKLEKVIDNLNKPWSLSFIDEKHIIFTEKSGKIYHFNLKNKKKN